MESRKVILILGKTGCGKSTIAKKIITLFPRKITIDFMGEYEGLIVKSYNQFLEYYLEEKPDNFNVICRFEDDNDIQKIIRAVWEIQNCLFVAEEISYFTNPRKPFKEFDRLVNFGRHRKISILGIARRVPEMNIQFRSMFTSLITFKQTEPNDLTLLESYGFNSQKVSQLEPHKFLMLGDDSEIKDLIQYQEG